MRSPLVRIERQYFFEEPRLHLTAPGRLTVRILGSLTYLTVITATFTFLASDLPSLNWLGVFFGLFLVDRVIHYREPDRLLSEMPSAGRVNLAEHLSPAAYSVLERAFDRSGWMQESFHLRLMKELLKTGEVREALRRLDIPLGEFKEKLNELLQVSRGTQKLTRADRRAQVEGLILRAYASAAEDRQQAIETGNLASALPLVEDDPTARLFVQFEIGADDLRQAILFGRNKKEMSGWRIPERLGAIIQGRDRILRHRIMNRAWTSRPTPLLDKVSDDLTDRARAKEIGFLIGHEEEFRRMLEVLARPSNPNVILVGDEGAGKHAMVEHLAFHIAQDTVPAPLFDRRVVELRLSELVAAAPAEELQERIRKIAEEIRFAGNVMLYIPDIHNLAHTSGTAFLSAADALMPIFRANAFPVVGSTFPREYKSIIEPRSDFASLFEAVQVDEITEEEAVKVLVYESLILERTHKVFITFGAVKTAVRLAKRHLRPKLLPDAADELLKTAVVAAVAREEKVIESETVMAACEERVNVPIRGVDSREAAELLKLEETIHARLIDQEEAVKAVADSLRQYRSGLARSGGPIASFLFVGPTGVGKTELAKILASVQFGSEAAMIRFDMTEYQEKSAVARFIGTPDGRHAGALTEAVRAKPYALVLLDEFEKAHPDILNLFLQVLDDGRLTDHMGRVVDFQNTIVIATSNAHSDIINDSLRQGESMSNIGEYLKRRLTDIFRPELVNRFSKIIVFRDLSAEHMVAIARLNLRDLTAKCQSQGLTLTFEEEAIVRLAKLGYDPAFGARPLRRVIDERIRAPLSSRILEGKARRGAGVHVVWKDEQFKFITQFSDAETVPPRSQA